jgi:hypothetical protein
MKAARAWHAAIWLKERGAIFNNKQFHELVGIASSTTWNILKRIEMVIHSHMDEENVSVSSSALSDVYGRRSRMTPKEAHPRQEEDSIEHTHTEKRPSESVNRPDLSSFEEELYAILSETPVHCDTLTEQLQKPISEILSGLTMLEIAGLASAAGSGRYARTSTASNTRSGTFATSSGRSKGCADSAARVKPIIDFIKRVFQSVSRKYIQLYTATHWLHSDSTKWGIDSLFQACARFRDIGEVEILDFVSPSMVLT